jgi:tetratricopeptide (TPR) repeat protein
MINRIIGDGERVLALAVCVFVVPVLCLSQDLGSSTGIFKSPATARKPVTAPKPKPAPVKKTAPKPKSTAASVKKPAAKPVRKRPAAKSTVVVKSEPKIRTNPVPDENVIITVGSNVAEEFEKAIDAGNNARDEREYARAESAYRRARALDPRDSRAVYGLGNLYADQQRWEEAENFYRTAIRTDPGNPGPYVALSYVLAQPIHGADLSNRYSESEQIARKALEIDPRDAFAWDQLGVALELRGLIGEETQQAYRRAIAIEAEFALAYAHLGRLYRRLGKANESVESYRRAIRYATDVPTMILVADVMQSQQQYLESEELLRRALGEDPRNPTALNLLGRALTTRNSFDEAQSILMKSVQVNPDSVVAYALLSSLHQRRGRLDDAEKVLADALRIVSENERRRLAREYETLGDAFLKIRRADDAARLYRQAMALDATRTILSSKIARP